MIRDRLKDMDIKITELANYLQISRPTMYKFIESYDNKKRAEISPTVLKLFDYIEDNELAGKNTIISYILNDLAEIKDADNDGVNKIVAIVKNYVSSNPNSEKTQFLQQCIDSSEFDMVIHYLIDIKPIFSKRRLSKKDVSMLAPYNEIISIYTGINKERK